MNSYKTFWNLCAEENCGHSVSSDRDCVASTARSNSSSGRNFAIGAGRKTGLKRLVEVDTVLSVKGDESAIASRERNLIVSVVPPVGDVRAISGISELDHLLDLMPAVLTNPTVVALTVRVEGRRQNVLVDI